MPKRVEEKRQYLRLNIPVEIEYTLSDSQKLCKSVTKDISALGLRFTSSEELKKGSGLEIKLKLPNIPNPVHASGRIAWIDKIGTDDAAPFDVGVEFLKIEEDNKNTFLKYLCDLIYG